MPCQCLQNHVNAKTAFPPSQALLPRRLPTFSLLLFDLQRPNSLISFFWLEVFSLFLSMDEAPIFRAPKRRKVIKPTFDSSIPSPNQISPGSSQLTNTVNTHFVSDDDDSAKVVRGQRHHAGRKAGIHFTASSHREESADAHLTALVSSEAPPPPKIVDIPNRFVNSSGQVVDVDKHMYVVPFSSTYVTNMNSF